MLWVYGNLTSDAAVINGYGQRIVVFLFYIEDIRHLVGIVFEERLFIADNSIGDRDAIRVGNRHANAILVFLAFWNRFAVGKDSPRSLGDGLPMDVVLVEGDLAPGAVVGWSQRSGFEGVIVVDDKGVASCALDGLGICQ